MKVDIELADLQAFAIVVESGGFTEAARRLGTTKSVLSRRVSVLEQRLGAVLLERVARGIRTTEVGAVYYAKCVRILESVDAASDFVASFHNLIRGRLRVKLGNDVLARRLAPFLHAFAAAYPQIVLDIVVASPSAEDGSDPDVAIRLLQGDEEGWVCLPLRECQEILCASPDYLATYGAPTSLRMLADHDGLLDAWRDTRGGWELSVDGQSHFFRVRERLRSTSADRLIQAAEAGLGITLQPDCLVTDAIAAGRLTPVLVGHGGAQRTLAALYTPSRRNSKKVRALLTFLQERIGLLSSEFRSA